MYDQFLIHAKNNYNMAEHCFLNNGNGMGNSNVNGTGRQIRKRYPSPPIYSETREITTLTHWYLTLSDFRTEVMHAGKIRLLVYCLVMGWYLMHLQLNHHFRSNAHPSQKHY